MSAAPLGCALPAHPAVTGATPRTRVQGVRELALSLSIAHQSSSLVLVWAEVGDRKGVLNVVEDGANRLLCGFPELQSGRCHLPQFSLACAL